MVKYDVGEGLGDLLIETIEERLENLYNNIAGNIVNIFKETILKKLDDELKPFIEKIRKGEKVRIRIISGFALSLEYPNPDWIIISDDKTLRINYRDLLLEMSNYWYEGIIKGIDDSIATDEDKILIRIANYAIMNAGKQSPIIPFEIYPRYGGKFVEDINMNFTESEAKKMMDVEHPGIKDLYEGTYILKRLSLEKLSKKYPHISYDNIGEIACWNNQFLVRLWIDGEEKTEVVGSCYEETFKEEVPGFVKTIYEIEL